MNRRLLTILPAIVMIAMGLLSINHQFSASSANLPAIAAPAPPEVDSSRKQESGPSERYSWETMRLVDPATGRVPADIHRREQEFAAGLPKRGSTIEQPWSAKSNAAEIGGWQYRGPWNIGGRTRALSIDVSDLTYQTLLAGGISGGMWRSTDGGNSWTLATGSSQLHAVSAVAQDTRAGHENVWYYGTGEIRGNSASGGGASYRGDGVFKSTDSGVTWSLIPSTGGASEAVFSGEWQYVNRLAIDSSEAANDELYAAVFGFIERSIDGGDTWDRVLGNNAVQSRYTDVVVSKTGVVYASLSSDGGTRGVFRSTDGGTWTDITPASLTSHSRIVLALAPSDESILYMLVSDINGTTGEGFYKYTYISGDGSGVGGSWDNRSAQMAGVPGHNGDAPLECYGSYCQTVTVNPTDPDQVYVGGMHLNRSTDGFATNGFDSWIGGWLYDNHHADQHWLVFVPGSSTVAYSGSDGGVHKTDDITAGTVNWTSLANGYNTSQFYYVAIDENLPGSNVMIGGMQDNGTWFSASTDGTEPWVEVFGGDGSACAVVDASGAVGTYLVSVQNGKVYRMEVNNTTGAWTTWTRLDPTGGGAYLFINPFILNPDNTEQLYIGSSNGVWRNSDVTAEPLWSNDTSTLNWTHLTTAPTASISALAMSPGANHSLYYGSAQGHMYRLDNADTVPAGSVPTALNMGGSWPSSGYVSSIAVSPDPSGLDRVLVSVSNYGVTSLFYSNNSGSSWTPVEGNLSGADGPSVRSVAIVPYNYTSIFLAGTSTGLYSTFVLDGAATVWTQESPDLMGNVVVDDLTSRSADGLVVAATHGKGIYSMTIPVTTGVEDQLPRTTMVLRQNVPNPFNPQTQISFALPEAGQTSLVVYDVAGRHVRTLVEASLAGGEHTYNWNGADDAGHQVSTGVYLYRLRSGAVEEIRRMTLVR